MSTQDADSALQEVVGQINAELRGGKPPHEVVRALVAAGFPEASAAALVAQVSRAQSHTSGPMPPPSSRLVESIAGWGGLIVAFVVLNGILYGGQELLARDDVRDAERIETELQQLASEIEVLDRSLASAQTESDRIDALGERLENSDVFYSSESEHRRDLERFNADVERWNSVMLPQMNQMVSQRNRIVDRYNQLLSSYDEVATRAYSRWWLLPVPMPSRARSRPQNISTGG